MDRLHFALTSAALLGLSVACYPEPGTLHESAVAAESLGISTEDLERLAVIERPAPFACEPDGFCRHGQFSRNPVPRVEYVTTKPGVTLCHELTHYRNFLAGIYDGAGREHPGWEERGDGDRERACGGEVDRHRAFAVATGSTGESP